MSDKANAINDVDFLFERLIKTIKGRADVAQRLTAHVFAKTGHTTLEALYSSEDENTLKVIQECLKAALANPPDYSALMGSEAKGQASEPPAITLVRVTDKGTTSKEIPISSIQFPSKSVVPDPLLADPLAEVAHMKKSDPEKTLLERVPELGRVMEPVHADDIKKDFLKAMCRLIKMERPSMERVELTEDRVRAIVREEIRAFFSTLGK